MKWLTDKLLAGVAYYQKKSTAVLDDVEYGKALDARQRGDNVMALAMFENLAPRVPLAAVMAGEMYLFGRGVKASAPKALELLESAHERGELEGTCLLGMALSSGYAGIRKDYARAIPLLELAAQANISRADEMLKLARSQSKMPGKRAKQR